MTAVLTPPRSAPHTPPAPQVVTPHPVAVATAAPQLPPRSFRFTLNEYRDLGKSGFFHDRRTMLLDGEIILMANPSDAHDIALGKVDDWARTVFTVGHHVRNQMGFDVGEDTDPSPDLVVAVGARADYANGKPRTAALLVEVADSSLFLDTTTTKAKKYATAQVPEYWVIDLDGRQLIVFRDPAPLPAALGANAYRQRHTYGPADSVTPLAAPNATVTVGDLLP